MNKKNTKKSKKTVEIKDLEIKELEKKLSPRAEGIYDGECDLHPLGAEC